MVEGRKLGDMEGNWEGNEEGRDEGLKEGKSLGLEDVSLNYLGNLKVLKMYLD